jgi:hypothetical protein
VQAHEASWSGESGGHAAERRDGVAARLRNSGEAARVTRCTGSTTSGTGAMLTSWRSSGAAPRRREDDDGAESKAAALGFRVRCGARGGGR